MIWINLIFCSWRNQTWAQSFSQTCFLRTKEDKAWFTFVKLPNRWVTPQLNGLIYLSAHVWEIHTETISILPINLLLVFFFFIWALTHAWTWRERHSTHPWNRPRVAHWRRWDEQQCRLSLSRSTGITIWLGVHLASALHPFPSTQPSSEKCTVVQCRATWEGLKLSAKAKKLNNNFHIINPGHGLIPISCSARFSFFNTLGHSLLAHAQTHTYKPRRNLCQDGWNFVNLSDQNTKRSVSFMQPFSFTALRAAGACPSYLRAKAGCTPDKLQGKSCQLTKRECLWNVWGSRRKALGRNRTHNLLPLKRRC